MIKEPEVPEIAEYYVIVNPTRGYSRRSIYSRPEFTKCICEAQFYSSLNMAQYAFKEHSKHYDRLKIKKLIMCVD